MLRLIILFLLLGIISWGASWLFDNDGIIVARWLGYEVQTSVAVIIIAVAIFLSIAALFLQVILWLRSLPRRWSHRRDVDHYDRGLVALTEGYTALAAGDIRTAKQASRKSKQLLGKQPLSLMLSAQVAQQEGNSSEAKQQYASLLEDKTTKLIGLKGLLSEARREGNMKRALELAEEAYDESPNTHSLVPTLLELYKRGNHWSKAFDLIEKSQHKKTFKQSLGNLINVKREKSLLTYMRAQELYEEELLEQALISAEKAYNYYPKFIPAVLLVAKLSLDLNHPRKACNIIKKAWHDSPRQPLAEIYLHAYEKENAKKRLKAVERLAEANPEHPESHLIVAIAAMEAENPSKARNHIKLGMAERETVRQCNTMAQIEESDEKGDATVTKKWLERASMALPDPTWCCKHCGHLSSTWHLLCSQCGAMDSLLWTEKPELRSQQQTSLDNSEIPLLSA